MKRLHLVVMWSTMAILAAGCRRAPPPPASDGLRRPTRPSPTGQLPFTHPFLAGRREEPASADCSHAALSRLVERVRSIESALPPGAEARNEPGLRETRDELIPQAAACVGHDGPLDVPWEMLHSATLSLEICTDVSQQPDERAQRCRRALDISQRADHSASERRQPAKE